MTSLSLPREDDSDTHFRRQRAARKSWHLVPRRWLYLVDGVAIVAGVLAVAMIFAHNAHAQLPQPKGEFFAAPLVNPWQDPDKFQGGWLAILAVSAASFSFVATVARGIGQLIEWRDARWLRLHPKRRHKAKDEGGNGEAPK